MGTREQVDFMIKFNDVRPGLNFLVPSFWWDEFYEKNRLAQHFHQIQLPDTHPLEILLSCSVIQQQPAQKQHFPTLQKLQNAYVEGWVLVQRQLRELREQLREERGERRGRECDWWTEGSLGGAVELFSPQIVWSNLEDMGMKEMSWQVVCPQLYRHLTDYYGDKLELSGERLTAVTVFVQPDQHIPSMAYHLERQRTPVLAVSFSFNRPSFLFSGFVENNLTISQFLQWLAEGLRIWNRQDLEEQRNSVFYYDHNVYYDFFDGGVSVQGLPWQSFSRIGRENVHCLLGKEIVEYSYWLGEPKENNVVTRRNPLKKVKMTNLVQQITRKGFSRLDNKKSTMEIQPSNRRQQKRMLHYTTGGKIRVLKAPPQSSFRELHSSTQVETPEEKLQKQKMGDSTRIPFSMFKVGKIDDYRKMSETMMCSFVSALEIDPNVVLFPRKTICGVVIQHFCNQIIRNESGKYEEEEGMRRPRRASEEQLDEDVGKEMQKLIGQLGIRREESNDRTGSCSQPVQRAQPATAFIPRATINSHITLD